MFLNIIKNNSYFKNIYSLFFKNGEKIYNRKQLFDERHKKTLNIESNEFKASGLALEEINVNLNPEINSVLGWLPYLKNMTSIIIYNFFSSNYSIRKQFILRISLVKKYKTVSQKTYLLPAYSIEKFNLKKIFENLDGDTVFVELFHPHIRKNHGGHDGHLRAWGVYYDGEYYNATVHTSRLSMNKKFSHKFNVTRNFNPVTIGTSCFNHSIGSYIKRKNDTPVHEGYNIVIDENNKPRAIWHHGHAPNKKSLLNNKYFKSVQSFWCPELDGIDPTIFIDSMETGVLGENEVEIFLVKQNKETLKKKLKFKNTLNLSISEIFNENIKGSYICHVSFKHNYNDKYIHVNYNIKKNNKVYVGDCVHSLESNLLIDENNKINPLVINKQSNALKFMHFSKFNEIENYYLIIYVPKLKNFQSQDLKIRIFTDKKDEHIIIYRLNSNQNINVINLKELFKTKKIQLNINSIGIVQIESTLYNYAGYLMKTNNKNNSVAIDHLTGG